MIAPIVRAAAAALLLLAAPLRLHADAVDDCVQSGAESMHLAGVSMAVVKSGAIVKTADTAQPVSSCTSPPQRPRCTGSLHSPSRSPPRRFCSRPRRETRARRHHRSLPGDDSGQLEGHHRPPAPAAHLRNRRLPQQRRRWNLQRHHSREIVANLGPLPLELAPGTRVAYSNSGYLVLVMIVERLTRKRYDLFMRERIFAPLHMTSTRRDDPDEVIAERARAPSPMRQRT